MTTQIIIRALYTLELCLGDDYSRLRRLYVRNNESGELWFLDNDMLEFWSAKREGYKKMLFNSLRKQYSK